MFSTNPVDHVITIIDRDESRRHQARSQAERAFNGRPVIIQEFQSVADWINNSERADIGTRSTVIIDANTPSENGELAAKQIWNKNSRCTIVFWSYAHRAAYLAEIRRMVPIQSNFAYVLQSDDEDALAFALTSVCVHNNTYISPACRDGKAAQTLTRIDFETLLDVAFGLTDKAISQRRSISVRGVQNRLTTLLQKLGCDPTEQPLTADGSEFFNSRTKLVYEAFAQGHLTRHDIAFYRAYFEQWAASAQTQNTKALTAGRPIPLQGLARMLKTEARPIPLELQASG